MLQQLQGMGWEVLVLKGKMEGVIGRWLSVDPAQHTFATMMLTHGVSLETISKMLGHSDTRMTQHYAKVLKEKISNKLDLSEKNLMDKEVLA